MLYKAYAEARNRYLSKTKKISEYASENIAMQMLSDFLKNEAYIELDVAIHVPLRAIIKDLSMLNEDESNYVMNPGTHVDYVIFRKIDNSILMGIEVDGYHYHRAGTPQANRDMIKDQALDKYGISLLRLNTTGSQEEERLRKVLKAHGYA